MSTFTHPEQLKATILALDMKVEHLMAGLPYAANSDTENPDDERPRAGFSLTFGEFIDKPNSFGAFGKNAHLSR